MDTLNKHLDLVSQLWERPFSTAPGVWKRQLATRYLELAGRGNLPALRQLLSEHPECLNKRGPHNRTLIWEATRRGRLDAIQWLLEQGAEVNATGCYNSESYVQITPYCAAVYYRHPDIAAYLRSHGAEEDIFRAAFLGDRQKVARELDAHPDLLNAEDPFDNIYYTPLLAFVVAGSPDPAHDLARQSRLLEFLLEKGASVAPYSAQLLGLAAKAGHLDFIEQLIAHGADERTVDSGFVVPAVDTGIIRYLLSHGASASRPGKNGFPPLNFVVRGDKGEHPEKVQALLEYGADVNARGPQGKTALHLAASAGFLQVIQLLLNHGADPTLTDAQGMTALDLARAAGKEAAAKLLSS